MITGQTAIFQFNFSICELNFKLLWSWMWNVCTCNVYQACCDELVSTLDSRVKNQVAREHNPATFLFKTTFFKIKHAHLKSSILHQMSHLHSEYCKSREKSSDCPVSCSGLCPTNLEDESLMSWSAYRIPSALCQPQTGITGLKFTVF